MKRKLIIASAIVAAILIAAYLLWNYTWLYRCLHAAPRKAWKTQAIADIASFTGDKARLEEELAAARAILVSEKDSTDAWISDRGDPVKPPVSLLLMTNCEWIAYASFCSKEDDRIFDSFIGRGSNGKWYYSTYHFCRRMITLRMQTQPDSLADAERRYFLREFDGRSDECLRDTWVRKENRKSPDTSTSDPRASPTPIPSAR